MENSKGNNQHHIRYKGPINHGVSVKSQTSLSSDAARIIALSAWNSPGRLLKTGHFLGRLAKRNFDIFDAEFAIRNGRCIGGAEFSQKFSNYKYTFRCDVEGVDLKITFALDATQDYATTPLVILITGVWATSTGRRPKW